jgi:hypothetical protein
LTLQGFAIGDADPDGPVNGIRSEGGPSENMVDIP